MRAWLHRLLARLRVGAAARGAKAATSRPVVEELEPRILYAADLNPMVWHGAGPASTAIVASLDAGASSIDEGATAASTVDQQQRRREIVFVDAAVEDAQSLIDAIVDTRGSQADIEVVQLRADLDGLAQIQDVLASERNVDAVHIVSHGDAARLRLGSTLLDAAALERRADAMAAWRSVLSADADVMLWGCDVGQGAAGQAFIARMAELTGADVAASIDATGAASRGGDWVLEAATGAIESDATVSAASTASWEHLLALSAQGSETRVNTTTTSAQTLTSYGGGNVAMAAGGNYVVVWNDADSNSGDIFFQRYDAFGNAVGQQHARQQLHLRPPERSQRRDGRGRQLRRRLGQQRPGR